MTEIEKIAYAKTFIDKMAQGINPLDDAPVPEGDLVNNVRISRCLCFVSDVLRRICERGKVSEVRRPEPKAPFAISNETAENELISVEPLQISLFARKLRNYANENNMKPISITRIVNWLVTIDAIAYVTREDGKRVKLPTDKGRELGLITVRRTGSWGDYDQIHYTADAQRFIIDHIGAIAGN